MSRALCGDVVEVALGIGLVEIDRGRDQIAVDGQGRDDRFHAAAGAEQMAELALGGADGQLFGVVAEGGLDGLGLGQVAQRRAGAVGVDVIDVIGVDAGILAGPVSSPWWRRGPVRRGR